MGKRIEILEKHNKFSSVQINGATVNSVVLTAMQEYAEWLAERAFIAGSDWNDALFMRNEGEKCEVIDFKTWLEKIKTDTEWTGNVNY